MDEMKRKISNNGSIGSNVSKESLKEEESMI